MFFFKAVVLGLFYGVAEHTCYPFPEDVLDREYARITTEKHMHRRLINRLARNREIKKHWEKHPGSFEALKARVRLGIV